MNCLWKTFKLCLQTLLETSKNIEIYIFFKNIRRSTAEKDLPVVKGCVFSEKVKESGAVKENDILPKENTSVTTLGKTTTETTVTTTTSGGKINAEETIDGINNK